MRHEGSCEVLERAPQPVHRPQLSGGRVNRREFVTAAACMGSPLSAFADFQLNRGSAMPSGIRDERMAPSVGWSVYKTPSFQKADLETWIQLDLGSPRTFDAIRLLPSNNFLSPGDGFPVRFFIECSNDPMFHEGQRLVDYSLRDHPFPEDWIMKYPCGAQARYVRLTVTRLRAKVIPPLIGLQLSEEMKHLLQVHLFALSRVEVLAHGVDLAILRPVTADPTFGDPRQAQQLTRVPRPQGEGVLTDYAVNVTAESTWRGPTPLARSPLSGVALHGGLFNRALEDNVRYLLQSYTVDDLLLQFRERAGQSRPPSSRTPDPFWEEDLGGSNAGRFLMGAGNTLRWLNHVELRKRVDEVVRGISDCKQSNGYVMGYPEDTFFVSERGAYVRSWTTLGLIAAGTAGFELAFQLLRGYYDWFNDRPYLAQALRRCIQGGQGMIANTSLYFTPVGRAADLQVVQRYFQENYWLEALARDRPDAIWQYPYDRPHAYLLTDVLAYLDLYRATGEERYRNAVRGAWALFHDNWENVGGSISIIEGIRCPPKSHFLYERLGETCASAFWMLLNHQLHLLSPKEEKYVNEIEKSVYNVLLANQGGATGFRYHTQLVGRKEAPTHSNTCCEGQGTRLVGSLPEFIFSIADEGIFVNLFEASTLAVRWAGQEIRLEMVTRFPLEDGVHMKWRLAAPVSLTLYIRVPSWASQEMGIDVNGERVASGSPGSYVALERDWHDSDTVSFTLPRDFRLSKYVGADQIEGQSRYALEYGPVLMAAVDQVEAPINLPGARGPNDIVGMLTPVKDQPLHFTLSIDGSVRFVPYFEVSTEFFTCLPIIRASPLGF